MCALWNLAKQSKDADKRNRQLVSGILTDALDQRAKIRLAFADTTTSLKDISASFVSFDNSRIVLEVSTLKKASQSFAGVSVSCYFMVRDKTDSSISNFYTFVSHVQSVQMQPNGVVAFALPAPAELAPAQQRRSVRVGVDQERMPLFFAWHELPAGTAISETPPLLCSKAGAQQPFKIENISSCGLRLVVQNEIINDVLPKKEPGITFSFYFKAIAEPETPARPFMVNAVLRNIFSDPQKGETSLGFEYTDQGRMDKNKRLVWSPLKANELGDLSPFIFKWNLLDFYRDKRVDEG